MRNSGELTPDGWSGRQCPGSPILSGTGAEARRPVRREQVEEGRPGLPGQEHRDCQKFRA